MSQTHYIYLHGFASGPSSHKAQFFRQQFEAQGLSLFIPDFNQNDFQHLTLTRQLQQMKKVMGARHGSITLIGSSFGGLTAAWLAELHRQVTQLILLAPAFEFLDHWLPTFSDLELQHWRNEGYFPIFHYGEQRTSLLNYAFIQDLERYDTTALKRAVPTLIIHGVGDETIPLSASEDYASSREWVKLIAVQSDHTLANMLPELWRSLANYLTL